MQESLYKYPIRISNLSEGLRREFTQRNCWCWNLTKLVIIAEVNHDDDRPVIVVVEQMKKRARKTKTGRTLTASVGRDFSTVTYADSDGKFVDVLLSPISEERRAKYRDELISMTVNKMIEIMEA